MAAILSTTAAGAQSPDSLPACRTVRNLAWDNYEDAAGAVAKLQAEVTKLKAELDKLKGDQPK